MVCSYNGMLLSPPKWTNSATHSNMDESHKCNVEWNKPNIKLYILYDCIYIMFKTVKLVFGGETRGSQRM